MLAVDVGPFALEELDDAMSRSPSPDTLRRAFHDTARRIAANPYLGEAVGRSGYRRFAMTQFPL